MDAYQLFVFENERLARMQGFEARDGSHAADPRKIAWWPTKEVGWLRGRNFELIVVSEQAYRWENQDRLHQGLDLAKHQLVTRPKVMISL